MYADVYDDPKTLMAFERRFATDEAFLGGPKPGKRGRGANGRPKTILIIRESAFQVYCANTLFLAGVLDEVLVEDGSSVPGESASFRDILSTLKTEFLPPSSGGPGRLYREIVEMVADAKSNLKKYVPTYRGQGYSIEGLVWVQGFKDNIDKAQQAEGFKSYAERLTIFCTACVQISTPLT